MTMQSPSLLLLLLLLNLTPAALSSDAEALLAFKASADLSGRLRFPRAAGHCAWRGVRCAADGEVTRLVLEASGLNGTFPAGTLGLLGQVRILSLKWNSLSGPIPDLSGLVNLKALFLDHNRFFGGFPPSILSLHRLRTLDLSYNDLTGNVPKGIATSLDRLYCLRLEFNRLNGSVPPLNQSALKFFNVSGNDLSGPVPVTWVLTGFGPSAFLGNPGLCGEVVRTECNRSHFSFFHGPGSEIAPSPSKAYAATAQQQQQQRQGLLLQSAPPSQKMHKRAVVAIGFLAAGFMVIGFVGFALARKKRKNQRMRQGKKLSQEKSMTIDSANHAEVLYSETNSNHNGYDIGREMENGGSELAAAAAMSEDKVKKLGKSGCLVFCAGEAQVYTLEQLMRASAEMLGRGSAGTTYKAVLDNRLVVTVKRVDATKIGMAGKEAFERHMDAVGRLRHPNLVPLRAFFQAKEERLLVYDYQANGSLFSLIHGSRSTRAKPLHWTSCLKIAEDVAQGLAYIHQASRLVHGNLKSSNVLLGSDFEACLTDSCLLPLIEPSEGDDDSGYRAPETRKSNRRLSPRSDIYAFGVLLLELLTGKTPLQHPVLIATDLPVWVRSVREDEGADDERLMMIIDIAAACVRSSPESRPTTWQVLKMIQEVKEADAGAEVDNDSVCLS